MAHLRWLKDNDHTVKLLGLRNTQTGAYVNSGATVRIDEVRDERGSAVSAALFPVTLAAVSGTTTGEWAGTIPSTLAVSVGKWYKAKLVINPAGSPTAVRWLRFLVEEPNL